MKIIDISVIIPAWNAEAYIAQAIASVRCPDLEMQVIVVDDGSTDDTAAVAAKEGATVIPVPHGGAAKARNAGLSAAQGEWVLFLDADDLLAKGSVEAMYAAVQEVGVKGVFAKTEEFISPELSLQEQAACKPRKGSYGGILPGCSLLHRSLFTKVGGFNSDLKTGETVDWQMRLRETGEKTVQLDRVTLLRRLHPNSTGRRNAQQERQDYMAILRARMRDRQK